MSGSPTTCRREAAITQAKARQRVLRRRRSVVAAPLPERRALTRFSVRARPWPDISRIDSYAPAELIGREADTKLIDDAWAKAVAGEPRPRVLTFVALGGEGKTALVAKWAIEMAVRGWPDCEAAFAWSFYSQGAREQQAASSDLHGQHFHRTAVALDQV